MTIDKENFIVPNYYVNNINNQFITGKNISGIDVREMSLDANYLLGNGMVQIPNCAPAISTSYGTSKTFRVRPKLWSNVHDRYWNIRVWSFEQNSGFVKYTISSPNNGTSYIQFNVNDGTNFFSFKENCQYTGEVWTHDDCSVIFENYSNIGANSVTRELTLFNAPTRYLNPTTQLNEVAVNINSNQSYNKIYSTAYKENSSIAGIAKGIDYFKNNYFKGIHSFFDSYETNFSTTWDTGLNTDSSVMSTGSAIPSIAFATATKTTQLSKSVHWEIYAATQNAAEPGRFEISTSYGNAAVNFSNTTPTWLSGTVLMQTDTPLHFAGINANLINNTSGNLTFKLGKTVDLGSNRVSVWTIHIYEQLGDAV